MSQYVKGLKEAAKAVEISHNWAKTLSQRGKFVRPTRREGQWHLFDSEDLRAWKRLRRRR